MEGNVRPLFPSPHELQGVVRIRNFLTHAWVIFRGQGHWQGITKAVINTNDKSILKSIVPIT